MTVHINKTGTLDTSAPGSSFMGMTSESLLARLMVDERFGRIGKGRNNRRMLFDGHRHNPPGSKLAKKALYGKIGRGKPT